MNPIKPVGTMLVILAVAASPARAAEKTFEKSLPAVAGQTLHLDCDGGSVTVEGADVSSVTATAKVRASEKRAEAYQLSAEAARDGIKVSGKDALKDAGEFGVEIRVKVPKEYALDVRTAGGELSFTGITGRVHAETGGGSISVRGMKGPQDLRTGGGSIAAADVEGGLVAKTGGGEISVRRTKGQIRVATQGGSIEIFLPKKAAAAIDLSTAGGEVSCDLPVARAGKADPFRIVGTLNGGGPPISAHSQGGSVRIRAE
jgi:DUF4097 and DUF4098 domain-containing protein YvlB